MAKVAVFGSTGMLGSTLTRFLESKFKTVYEFNRSGISVTGSNVSKKIDVTSAFNPNEILGELKVDYIVNCIGMIKQLIDEKNSNSVELANRVNHEFPSKLDAHASKFRIPLIQIGTDCVYSGKRGKYSENDEHDPVDLYGRTKSLGEKSCNFSMIVRCSIVGKESKSQNSLMSWVLSQPKGARVNGYVNHIWNGVTTLQFSQIVYGIIKNETYESGVSHLVPNGVVNKYELITSIAKEFDRSDLLISKFEAEIPINRSLTSINSERNLQLWRGGGYDKVPTIGQMLSTYSSWTKAN